MNADSINKGTCSRIIDENAALRLIIEGTAKSTGTPFFGALVESLSRALHTRSAWVSEYRKDTRQLHVLAMSTDGRKSHGLVMDVEGTPCQGVVENGRMVHYDDNIADFFPADSHIKQFGAVSYMGVPLLNVDGDIMGNLAVMDTRPMQHETRAVNVIRIFADRATAELQRLQAERRVLKSEEKYRRIVETTDQGFLLLDARFTITDTNAAFCRMAGLPRRQILGRTPIDFTTKDFGQFLWTNRKEIMAGTFKGMEGKLISSDGSHVPVLIYGNGLTDDEGAAMGTVVFVVDITPQKRTLTLAGEVQRALLPQRTFSNGDFELHGRTKNCEEIGGDYFDFIEETNCSEDTLSVVVGDVSGHGVEAALLMTSARALLRMRASQCGEISSIVEEMNRHLSRDVFDSGRFMTLFYLRIDEFLGEITWVRAGHPPALLYDPTRDRFRELMGEGIALGIDADYRYMANGMEKMKSGQIVAIGTDGIWEACNQRMEPYGKERFCKLLRSHASKSAEDIIAAAFEDLADFTRGQPQEDDITLVVIKAKEKTENDFYDYSI